ncbi:helix-turn-helix domain-containing protein [Streptomyces sp. NBC_00306]|uniref:helix-turn-helix domain-containing protein n=1 Tax=Streptomyces sp. NBC_00306 TaxID=2975708 RepID=UPI002E27BD9E|nr:helix-turn-helix domain-containing protein [Streptomyces sp. NBC_00306]
MAIRIHFTVQDLARTRVAEAPMPLHELELAVRALQSRSQPARFEAWRRRARAQLSVEARMALALMPAVGRSPGFLSPAKAGPVDELLEQVRTTPRDSITANMRETAMRNPALPGWSRDVAHNASLLTALCTGLRHLHAELLAPHWNQFTEHLAADRGLRLQQQLTGGVEQLLSRANPRWMRWNPPVLEVRLMSGAEGDLQLEGQGLLLVPTMFSRRPVLTHGNPVAVSYPVCQDLSPLEAASHGFKPGRGCPAHVSMLVGRTRARVLTAIADHQGCSTGELAAHAAIAPASASEHATVLRAAGLIRSLRHHNTVSHSLTPLGLALLSAPEGA